MSTIIKVLLFLLLAVGWSYGLTLLDWPQEARMTISMLLGFIVAGMLMWFD